MSRRALLLAAALSAALPAAEGARAAGGKDAIEALAADPSASASERLKRLLSGTKSADQRFWLVRTLGVRAKEHKDEAALEALLASVKDPEPMVRGEALRSLSAFDVLGRERAEERWLTRLDAAARAAVSDRSPAVREGAKDLKRALDVFRDPAARGAPDPAAGARPRWRLTRALGYLWLLVLPVSAGLWLLWGRPVFDASSAPGRRASAAAAELRRRGGLLAATAVLWGGLGALLVGWGFELLIRTLGEPASEGGSWGAAYLAVWFCWAAPGAFAAAAAAREPEGGGLAAALEAAPQVALLCLAAAAFLGPAELLYKLLWRRGRRPAGSPSPWAALAEEGTLSAVARASAAAAEEGVGLVPALCENADAAAPRLGLAAYDPRFAFLLAAPAVTVVCSLAASSQAAEWTAPRATVMLGCTLWAWTVLAGLLSAVLAALEGLAAGARHRRRRGLSLPDPLSTLAAPFEEPAP
ncbi:HEAT repeat domain-containing protein [bacterium]|nr:MAG: HEAT repeat domain-containing protein [bacterium]